MRLDAETMNNPWEWRVFDAAQGNAQMNGVVAVDDETHEYWTIWAYMGAVVRERHKADQLVVISTGLKMVWVNVKPEALGEMESLEKEVSHGLAV